MMKSPKPEELYQKAVRGMQIGISNEQVYVKNKKYWKRLTEAEAVRMIRSLYSDEVQPYINDSSVKEAIKRLMGSPHLQLWFTENMHENYLNLQNGVFDVEAGEIVENGDFQFSYVLNFSYEPDLKIGDAPIFQKFVESVFPEEVKEKTSLLLQILGFCVSDYRKAKAGFFLIGAADSGKSTMLNLLKRVLPENTVTAIPLQRLSNRFNLARLVDSKVNIVSEISEKSFDAIDVFKQLTSYELVTAENKGCTPFEFQVRCKTISAGNFLPNLEQIEGMDAILNRMIVLLFPKSISKEEQDFTLLDKLFGERDEIFSLALDELVELNLNTFAFTIPQDTKRMMEQLKARGQVFESFIQDRCELKENARVHLVDLYEEFCGYCRENLLDAKFSKTSFSQKISAIPGVRKSKFRIAGSSPRWGVEGLAVRYGDFDKGKAGQEV